MLKGFTSGLARLFARKPVKDDAPSVNETALQPWQQQLLNAADNALREDRPLVVNHRRGKSELLKVMAEVQAKSAPKLHRKDDAFIDAMIPQIQKIQAEGITSQNGIARRLNALGFTTRTGKQFNNVTVANILAARGMTTGSPKKGGHPRKPSDKKASTATVTSAALPGKTEDMKKFVERTAKPKPVEGYDAIAGQLSEPVRRRAEIVVRNKMAGGKVLSAEEVTEIERRLAAGEVIVYPAYIDSEGWNHLEGRHVA